MTAAYDTWVERLDSGRLTKSQCQQFDAAWQGDQGAAWWWVK